jgi:hypothetical protein
MLHTLDLFSDYEIDGLIKRERGEMYRQARAGYSGPAVS